MEFIEKNLRFTFDDDIWQVIKYDDTSLYRDGIEKVPESKAVDFIGIQGSALFFIEVKDFRGYRIDNQKRIIDGELPNEIGQKIRDSVAGLVGAYRTFSKLDQIAPYSQILFDRAKDVKVVVWLEHDLPIYLPKREKVRMSVTMDVFKQKLRWLTTKVLVTNILDNPLSEIGLIVSNLPHLS